MTTNVETVQANAPTPMSLTNNDGKNSLEKDDLPEEAVFLVKGFRSRVGITSKNLHFFHHVILGILPCARITKHKQAAGSAKGALSTQGSRSPAE